jgi:hypothetical protein
VANQQMTLVRKDKNASPSGVFLGVVALQSMYRDGKKHQDWDAYSVRTWRHNITDRATGVASEERAQISSLVGLQSEI